MTAGPESIEQPSWVAPPVLDDGGQAWPLIATALQLMGVPVPSLASSTLRDAAVLEGIVRSLPSHAVKCVARALRVEIGQVGAVIGVSPSTLNRRETLHPWEGDRLYRVALVAAYAQRVFAPHPHGQTWLGQGHHPLLTPNPLAHLDTEIGVARVRAVLDRIAAGTGPDAFTGAAGGTG